jgi:hypothetical protein
VLDIALLATTVVANFVGPYLKLGADKLTETLAENVGQEAAEHTTGVAGKPWKRLQSLFAGPKEQAKLEIFQDEPEDLAASVAKTLRDKLAENPELAAELDALVNAPTPGGTSTGAQIMSAHIAGIFDARGATISGGTQAGVIYHATPQETTTPSGDASGDG